LLLKEQQAVAAPSIRKPARKTSPRRDTRETLNMRIRPELRSLIDQAAEVAGKNRTDFVLDAARIAAQNTLLDQPGLALNARQYAAFVALLDAPPQPNPLLRRSLQTAAPWD
jgi:uncharacterized protein (DUF1778 family)